jgi:phosphoglycolate phosphatase
MTHPPIIIFDVDGPIMNSKGHLLAVFELFRDKRFRWNEELKKKTTALEVLRKFEAADSKSSRQFLRKMNRNFRELLPHRVRRWIFFAKLGLRIRPNEYKYSDFIPKTVETLRYLDTQKIILGICSSSEGDRIQKWLVKKDVADLIPIFTSRDHRKLYGLKPSPGPLLGLLCLMKRHHKWGKIDRNKVVFVGDNVTDILSAKAARIKSIAVLSGHGYKKELKETNPEFILKTIAEIPSILTELFPKKN